MKVIADLHIHSRYSRATSPRLSPPWLERWARIKGIGLLGTGDCTHPEWLAELRAQMDDAEEGFFTLKKEIRGAFDAGPAMTEGLPRPGTTAPGGDCPRFVLTGEISTIYKKGNKTRKIHHLVILPDFKTAAAFNARLESSGGNIRSDGRPILGMDSRRLLATLLESSEKALLIPAHIWTPWFSVLGANSGFDSIEECYEDLAGFIPAVETGLSSNPAMNWALGGLDKFSIISNSDAHSPDKLGREATILDMPLSFTSLRAALAPCPPDGPAPMPRAADILGTIEFFPQEGKYHYDGHRKCGISLKPGEAAAADYLCPVCGKTLTRGVMGRVLELADRPVNEEESCPPDYAGTNLRPYYSLIPLREVCAELLGTGPASKKAEAAYYRLVEKGGSEFSILMDKDLSDLEKLSIPEIPGELLAKTIMKMRAGEVSVNPGYDGEYGTIRVFAPGAVPEISGTKDGKNLFGESEERAVPAPPRKVSENTAVQSLRQRKRTKGGTRTEKGQEAFTMDEDQEKAVAYNGKRIIIIAGPGTGKTAVLSARIARLIENGVDPASILALSFTVKAAAELRERLRKKTGGLDSGQKPPQSAGVTTATFHSFCCSVLREQSAAAGLSADFRILGEEERDSLLRETAGKRGRRLGNYIEERKRFLLLPGDIFPKAAAAREFLVQLSVPEGHDAPLTSIPPADPELEILYAEYRKALKDSGSLDFEDLTAGTVRLFSSRPEVLEFYRRKFCHIFVDEYQDINFSQYILIRLLAPNGGAALPSLCVIGDPNQAIYGFRGSDKRFISRFLTDYPEAGHFELSRSFRCAEPIINAAGKLTGSRLIAAAGENSAETSLYRTHYATEKSEAEGIARIIETLVGGTSFFAMDSRLSGEGLTGANSMSPGDCAVLVRAAALAAPIIKALKDHGIPFEFSGEVPWWKKEPVDAIVDMLRKQKAAEKDSGRGPAAKAGALIQSAWEEFAEREKRKYKKEEPPELVKRLTGLLEISGDLSSLLDTLDSCAASGIPEPELAAEALRGFPALPAAKTGTSLAPNDGVKVMTIHASKGLEFEQVFVPGLEEGILPFTLFDSDGGGNLSETRGGTEIEEERRLLYVAMTRAKKGLWLSFAGSRVFRGRKLEGGPSRFLSELETIIPLAQGDNVKKGNGQLSLF